VKNTLSVKEVYNYSFNTDLKVLFLDVRTREEFDIQHIEGDAVVCIEPSVLLREK